MEEAEVVDPVGTELELDPVEAEAEVAVELVGDGEVNIVEVVPVSDVDATELDVELVDVTRMDEEVDPLEAEVEAGVDVIEAVFDVADEIAEDEEADI